LYAIDVDPNATNQSDVLEVAWYYSYLGQGQASPTLINNTVYFDAFNGNYTTLDGSKRNPRIYAVYTNGTLRWKRNYANITGFSFAMDPRGGFWYNDMGDPFHGGGGRKVVRFSTQDGSILEELNVSALLHDPERVYPVSCMTIGGSATYPIMIVSANHFLFHPGKFIIAINLTTHEVLWKVPITSPTNFNFCAGQYTILNNSGQYRVLFSTMTGGVMAIGCYPNNYTNHGDAQYLTSSRYTESRTLTRNAPGGMYFLKMYITHLSELLRRGMFHPVGINEMISTILKVNTQNHSRNDW